MVTRCQRLRNAVLARSFIVVVAVCCAYVLVSIGVLVPQRWTISTSTPALLTNLASLEGDWHQRTEFYKEKLLADLSRVEQDFLHAENVLRDEALHKEIFLRSRQKEKPQDEIFLEWDRGVQELRRVASITADARKVIASLVASQLSTNSSYPILDPAGVQKLAMERNLLLLNYTRVAWVLVEAERLIRSLRYDVNVLASRVIGDGGLLSNATPHWDDNITDPTAPLAKCVAQMAQKKQLRKQHVKVFLWNITHGQKFMSRYAVFNSCSDACKPVWNESELASSDAVLFLSPQWDALRAFLPPNGKPEHQFWILVTRENPWAYPVTSLPRFMSLMDLTSTYSPHSDQPMPYIPFTEVELWRTQPLPTVFDKAVSSLFISNCYLDWSNRFAYLAELERLGLNISSYGRCKNNRNFTNEDLVHFARNGPALKLRAASRHKFNLAFENSIAEDYVSEKVYEAFSAGVVPVYLGAPNIEDYLPDPNSIINANSLSPSALVQRIEYLLTNETAYQEYHKWRQLPAEVIVERILRPFRVAHPEITTPGYFKWNLCNLCSKLRSKIRVLRQQTVTQYSC